MHKKNKISLVFCLLLFILLPSKVFSDNLYWGPSIYDFDAERYLRDVVGGGGEDVVSALFSPKNGGKWVATEPVFDTPSTLHSHWYRLPAFQNDELMLNILNSSSTNVFDVSSDGSYQDREQVPSSNQVLPVSGDDFKIAWLLPDFPDKLQIGAELIKFATAKVTGGEYTAPDPENYRYSVDVYRTVPVANSINLNSFTANLNILNSGVLSVTDFYNTQSSINEPQSEMDGQAIFRDGIVNIEGSLLGYDPTDLGKVKTGDIINQTTINMNGGTIDVDDYIQSAHGSELLVKSGNNILSANSIELGSTIEISTGASLQLSLKNTYDSQGNRDPVTSSIDMSNGHVSVLGELKIDGEVNFSNLIPTSQYETINLINGTISGAGNPYGDVLVLNDIELHGTGNVGNNSLQIINKGTIAANGTTLTIDPNTKGIDNKGTLTALNGGHLKIQDGTLNNANNKEGVSAQDTASVSFQDMQITNTGGSIVSSPTGKIDFSGTNSVTDGLLQGNVSNSGDLTLRDITLAGDYTQKNKTYEPLWTSEYYRQSAQTKTRIEGTLTNKGQLNLEGTTIYNVPYTRHQIGSDTLLIASSATTTLAGTGVIDLKSHNASRGGTAKIIGAIGSENLINDGNRIQATQGDQNYLGDDSLSITNKKGVIAADGATLTIDTNVNGIDNQGTLTAINGGKLAITNDPFKTSGQVIIDKDSQLNKSGIYTQTAGLTNVNGVLNADQVLIEAGVLAGSGTINSDVIVSGEVSPGNSPGILTVNGDFTLTSTGSMLFEFQGYGENDFDQLIVHGNASLLENSTINLSFIDDFSPKSGDIFSFITADLLITDLGLLDFFILGLEPDFDFLTRFNGNKIELLALSDGVSIALSSGQSEVPLPPAIWLMGSGLAGFLGFRRKNSVQSEGVAGA